ncbi:MAG TPA: acyl-CoA dehydratase activase [Geothrix sp.]|nr:acyl-CoA dehydratase activase [Geothrix sp.]
MSKSVYVGLDIGSSRTKVAVLDADRKLLGHAIKKSGTDFSATAQVCLDASLEMAGATREDIVQAVSTGYGRTNVAFVTDQHKTEIGCLANWCRRAVLDPMGGSPDHGVGGSRGGHRERSEQAVPPGYIPGLITLIDIGGQDNKIVKLDQDGRRSSFKMNRKCAAGTGAFLEEMSYRLDIPIEDMDGLARASKEMVKLGSYCTVFSATEVLENIRNGKHVTDIVKGLFYSVVKRVLEMDLPSQTVVMTGGVVAHNPYIVDMTEEMLGRPVLRPEYPQLAGAMGAAVYAIEAKGESSSEPSEGELP